MKGKAIKSKRKIELKKSKTKKVMKVAKVSRVKEDLFSKSRKAKVSKVRARNVAKISHSVKVRSPKKADVKNISGILPDWLIEEYIQKEIIKVSPLARDWKRCVAQVSMDFHLGKRVKLFRAGTYRFVDTKRGLPDDAMEIVDLRDGDPFILEPGAFAIASTSEVLKLPNNIIGRLEGKSSMARLGILVHSTAARFDPGWDGAPVLELGNLGPKPAILYCGMAICAFTFEKLAFPVRKLYTETGRYHGSKDAIAYKADHEKKR